MIKMNLVALKRLLQKYVKTQKYSLYVVLEDLI